MIKPVHKFAQVTISRGDMLITFASRVQKHFVKWAPTSNQLRSEAIEKPDVQHCGWMDHHDLITVKSLT